MKRCIFTLLLLALTASGYSQRSTVNDTALNRQCSALREIIYQAATYQFAPLLDKPLRQSNGQRTDGQWTFSLQKYSTWLPWQGANQTTIEHATDYRDSTYTQYWQYIAQFNAIRLAPEASRLAYQLVGQINQCILPLTDSITANLTPVPPEELPPTMPEGLSEAYLFVLPAAFGPQVQISIMTGIEQVRVGYRPLLIIEWQKVEMRR
ncbi:MAG TPA: hypothetical protein PKD90_10925 [Phnomibacter sp.]|nr:hypothetical protein [Phnomibacter sp.]